MPEIVPMPADAAEFIRGAHRTINRRWRWFLAFFWLMALAPFVYWWLLEPFPSRDLIVGRIIVSLLPFTPILTVFWLIFRWRVVNLAKDSACDHLLVVGGEFKKCLQRGCGRGSTVSGEQGIKVAGVRLVVPYGVWRDLARNGIVSAEYFPNTRMCWRIDGQPVSWK